MELYFLKKYFALFLIGIMSLSSCINQDDLTYRLTIKEKTEYTAREMELFDKINLHRTNIGVQECEINNFVSELAYQHNLYMISEGIVSHDNFDSRVTDIVITLRVTSIAENIAYGYSSADSIVKGWYDSELHRRILENPDYNAMGIAITPNSDKRFYITNIMIKK